MISTTNYAALPPAADLQRLCKALAVLDAINSPDWEYRYYSYNPAWSDNEQLLEMRVNSIGTTFCLWYTPAHGWQRGIVENVDDGSEELLYIFDNQPATYAEWATEYYTDESDKKPVTAAAVAPIYRQEPVTKAKVLALVDEVEDWTMLATDLQEIGYPYEFS
jgi:hypothetical protein